MTQERDTDTPRAARKWRPSLAQVVAMLLGVALMLPLGGLVFLHVFENHFVRQAEGRLIAQTSALAAALADDLADYSAVLPTGAAADETALEHLEPELDARKGALPGPAESAPAKTAPAAQTSELGMKAMRLFARAQAAAGGRLMLLDALGRPIAAGFQEARTYAKAPEVARALNGHYASALRKTAAEGDGGKWRVWAAMPVIVDGHVRAVILASRAPVSLSAVVWRRKRRLALAAVLVLGLAALMGWVMTRAITGPIRALARRTHAIAGGRRDMQKPLKRHGTREITRLSDEMLSMSHKLFERSDYIARFAAHVSHELKSPLTAMRGAAELMLESGQEMSEAQRRRFLGNMLADTQRMAKLVERMRALAAADNPRTGGRVKLADIARALRARFADADIQLEGSSILPMTEENALIVFSNLAGNAIRHGAKRIVISARAEGDVMHVRVADDGTGISPGNAGRIFEPFFTTRRESGGTGLGLAIVQAMLKAHGGKIRLIPSNGGATFEITLPRA